MSKFLEWLKSVFDDSYIKVKVVYLPSPYNYYVVMKKHSVLSWNYVVEERMASGVLHYSTSDYISNAVKKFYDLEGAKEFAIKFKKQQNDYWVSLNKDIDARKNAERNKKEYKI